MSFRYLSGNRLIPVLSLLFILYVPFFSHLTRQPLRIWDETRVAVNAYEMMKDGDMIVTKFNHKPDMWNLKPPLLIWIQSQLMKIFGPWEIAIRLPSAIAGMLTALMIFIFAWRYYDRFWLGFMSAIVLATTNEYVNYHGARTGDFDSLLTFFCCFYCLSFFLFFEKEKWKYFWWGITGVILAALTKGIAGLFFLPVIGMAAIAYKKIRMLITSRHFYLSILLFLITVGGYYFLRDMYNPGYLQAVIDNEWGGRYNTVIEGHEGDAWFYFDKITVAQLAYWALLIPCGFIAGILDKEKSFRKFIWYLTSLFLFVFIMLSSGETKISWYTYPFLPFLALLIGTFLFYVFRLIEQLETPGIIRQKILSYVFILLVFFTPYRNIVNATYLAPENPWDVSYYQMGYYMRDIAKGKIKLEEPLNIVFDGVPDHFLYYVTIANENGADITLCKKEDLQPGMVVIVTQIPMDEYLQKHYRLEELHRSYFVFKCRILGRINS